jgi:tripartite-type tricarboxylate transporter receptor subunit TctC
MDFQRVLPVAAGALVLAISAPVAQSQSFPTQPIRIIVPLAPGGPIDLLTRALAENMSASL